MAKATRKQALGRGLSALLKDTSNDFQSFQNKSTDNIVGSIVELDLESIDINPFQPRTNFNEETLRELASSIKELGVIQPITVRKIDSNAYQLVSGERRYRASKIVGLKTIPAYIRIANDQESLEMALVENIQRQDLDPIEIALSYQRLIDDVKLTQEQMSERIGKKRSTIANFLRLLKLDPIIQTGMRDGFISMGHGRAIITIEDQNIQLDIYQNIISNKLSVRDTEALVRSLQTNNTIKASKKQEIPKYVKKGVKDFSEYFGHKINVQVSKNGKGKITIPFHSEEDFKRILKLVNRDK